MAEGWSSVQNWSSRLAPSTAKVNVYIFGKFTEWLKAEGNQFSGFTPDQLVKYQRDAGNGERFDILDSVEAWVLSMKGPYHTKLRYYTTVKSFFAHNRAELPKDPKFQIRGDVPKSMGNLTPDNVLTLIHASKPVYRAVFLSMFQAGLSLSDFDFWNRNGFEKLRADLESGVDIIRIDLPGRKSQRNKRPYYSFIGPDAITEIRNYMANRPKSDKAIFLDQFRGPISKLSIKAYWDYHLRKTGLIKPTGSTKTRYGKHRHEVRDLFRTLWAKSDANRDVAEFLLGHVVDPYDYNKAYMDEDFLRKEYRKALPWLNIISSKQAFGVVDSAAIDRANKKIAELEGQLRDVDSAIKNQQNLWPVIKEQLIQEIKTEAKRQMREEQAKEDALSPEQRELVARVKADLEKTADLGLPAPKKAEE